MKTKIRECFGLLVFVLTMLSLTSCEVEIVGMIMMIIVRYIIERHMNCAAVHGRKVGSKMENITPSDWTFMKIGPEKTIYEWSIEMAA